MKALVIKEHKTTYPKPISFKINEKVIIAEEDTEYPGWIWVKTKDDNEGWAPKEYLNEISSLTLCNYSAKELDIKLNEILIIKKEVCQWLYVLNSKDEIAWIPKECVLIL